MFFPSFLWPQLQDLRLRTPGLQFQWWTGQRWMREVWETYPSHRCSQNLAVVMTQIFMLIGFMIMEHMVVLTLEPFMQRNLTHLGLSMAWWLTLVLFPATKVTHIAMWSTAMCGHVTCVAGWSTPDIPRTILRVSRRPVLFFQRSTREEGRSCADIHTKPFICLAGLLRDLSL